MYTIPGYPNIKVFKDDTGLAVVGIIDGGTPPLVANLFRQGCIITSGGTNKLYINTAASTSAAAWESVTDITSSEISDGAITLAKLASGVSPSHVVKFAATSSAFGGGGVTFPITVTGAATTDIATAVIRASTNAVAIAKAVLTTNTLTITFSADPGAATTIDYSVLRAAL